MINPNWLSIFLKVFTKNQLFSISGLFFLYISVVFIYAFVDSRTPKFGARCASVSLCPGSCGSIPRSLIQRMMAARSNAMPVDALMAGSFIIVMVIEHLTTYSGALSDKCSHSSSEMSRTGSYSWRRGWGR